MVVVVAVVVSPSVLLVVLSLLTALGARDRSMEICEGGGDGMREGGREEVREGVRE